MGRTHARILRADSRVKLCAVFDVDDRRKQEVAKEFECDASASEEQLLDKVQAVYITVPNTQHAGAAGRAVRHERHVYCEKPFSTTLEDARSLRDLAVSARTIFQVGHNRRFAPVYRAVKEFLGREGHEPWLAHFKMNRGELLSPPWVGDSSVTGGYLYETPLHLLDMARWLCGEVVELRAMGAARTYGEPDNFSLLMRFASGLSLTFASCAHSTWAYPYERIELYGRYFTIETEEMERVRITPALREPTSVRDFHPLPFEEKMGYEGIDANFISAVLGEEAPGVTAEDGYRSVELVDRCYQQLTSDEWI